MVDNLVLGRDAQVVVLLFKIAGFASLYLMIHDWTQDKLLFSKRKYKQTAYCTSTLTVFSGLASVFASDGPGLATGHAPPAVLFSLGDRMLLCLSDHERIRVVIKMVMSVIPIIYMNAACLHKWNETGKHLELLNKLADNLFLKLTKEYDFVSSLIIKKKKFSFYNNCHRLFDSVFCCYSENHSKYSIFYSFKSEHYPGGGYLAGVDDIGKWMDRINQMIQLADRSRLNGLAGEDHIGSLDALYICLYEELMSGGHADIAKLLKSELPTVVGLAPSSRAISDYCRNLGKTDEVDLVAAQPTNFFIERDAFRQSLLTHASTERDNSVSAHTTR